MGISGEMTLTEVFFSEISCQLLQILVQVLFGKGLLEVKLVAKKDCFRYNRGCRRKLCFHAGEGGHALITGELKNKIDNIRQTIWNSGVSNPMTVVEQITYLMFIHSLDANENMIEQMEALDHKQRQHIFPASLIGQSMRWSRFRDRPAEEIYRIISLHCFPAIRNMVNGRLPDFNERGEMIPVEGGEEQKSGFAAFSEFMKDAAFLIQDPLVLQKVIAGLDDLFQNEFYADRDLQGDFYEYMLSQMSASGELGQFRTPKQIRELMVELVRPTPDDLICDPACGTAGFLISASEFIRRHHLNPGRMTPEQIEHFRHEAFTGFDTDPTMARLSSMNLVLHGIDQPNIRRQDSLNKLNALSGRFDLILANPPFKGSVDKTGIEESLKTVANTTKTELLFVALFLRMLKKGGRCACIVPDGVLFGSSNAHRSLRQHLIEDHQLQAVISMPSGVFKPYAGVSTAILCFTKTGSGGTDRVWFYDMKADGFTLDDKRNETKENDIPDIIERFRNLEGEANRERTEQSFFVPKQEIADNGYDLSINKYKKVEYQPVVYPPTSEIFAELETLQRQIDAEMAELKKMLSV